MSEMDKTEKGQVCIMDKKEHVSVMDKKENKPE